MTADEPKGKALMQEKYSLEFILHVHGESVRTIKNALAEFGDRLEITDTAGRDEDARDFKILIETQEPTMVFDVCSQFGRIKSVKINEGRGS